MWQYLSGMQRISKVAVVRQLDDGGVDTIFNGAEQIDSTWNRKMLIEDGCSTSPLSLPQVKKR